MIPVSNFDWEMKTKMLAVVFLYIYIYILQFRQSQLRFVIIYIWQVGEIRNQTDCRLGGTIAAEE